MKSKHINPVLIMYVCTYICMHVIFMFVCMYLSCSHPSIIIITITTTIIFNLISTHMLRQHNNSSTGLLLPCTELSLRISSSPKQRINVWPFIYSNKPQNNSLSMKFVESSFNEQENEWLNFGRKFFDIRTVVCMSQYLVYIQLYNYITGMCLFLMLLHRIHFRK